jgi:hypothetical protein
VNKHRPETRADAGARQTVECLVEIRLTQAIVRVRLELKRNGASHALRIIVRRPLDRAG